MSAETVMPFTVACHACGEQHYTGRGPLISTRWHVENQAVREGWATVNDDQGRRLGVVCPGCAKGLGPMSAPATCEAAGCSQPVSIYGDDERVPLGMPMCPTHRSRPHAFDMQRVKEAQTVIRAELVKALGGPGPHRIAELIDRIESQSSWITDPMDGAIQGQPVEAWTRRALEKVRGFVGTAAEVYGHALQVQQSLEESLGPKPPEEGACDGE